MKKQKKTVIAKPRVRVSPKIDPAPQKPTNPYEEPCDCADCEPREEGVEMLTTARMPDILSLPSLGMCRKEIFRHQVAIKNAQHELEQLQNSLETWKQYYNRQIDEDRSVTMGYKSCGVAGGTSCY